MYFETIRAFIAEQLGANEELIEMDTDLMKDLDADSLDAVEIIMAVEEQYDMEIPAEDMEELTTVGAVIEYLKTKGIEG